MGKKRQKEESSSSGSSSEEEEGNIGSLKANYSATKKKAAAERRKRDKVKKEPLAKKIVKPKQEANDDTTVSKKRRQPAESPDEKANKILGSYIYSSLKLLNQDAEITEQTVACLSDLIKSRIEAAVKRAMHFSLGGKKRVINHQAMWGAIRTMPPPVSLTKVTLLNAVTLISGIKGSQEQANAAWEAYSQLPDDALEIGATQDLLKEMEN